MKVSEVKRYLLFAGFLLVVVLSSFLSSQEKLKYTRIPTIDVDYKQNQTLVFAYSDSISGDSLYLVKTKDGIPLHYYKDIITEVCFDQECRLLEISVYWNITGRYLGFELPKKEFLSKYDHEPFVVSEYERLNDLLADPNLPLGNISFEKLIELPASEDNSKNGVSVDGVSGATSIEVSQMVVKGAAYTTFTLWKIVHGPTKDFVAYLTGKQVSSDLIDLILKSPDISDRVWALNLIDRATELTTDLETSLLRIISSDDFYMAYTMINTINSVHLGSDSFQLGLFSKN